jgi:MFS family permease
MRLPAALTPLRHSAYRSLWLAYVVTSLGTWLQNTGAGWLMTTLAPNPLIVSMVQAATILPVFLLALPAGALADIVDRRLFLIGTQVWTMLAAALLALLTLSGATGPWSLLALTFAIGIGAAMTGPAWGAIVPDLVPREDLVQAIALNGVGFNIARAVGPAIAGILLLITSAGTAFALFAVSILAVVAALVRWQPSKTRSKLPPENLISAMRAGIRFVSNTPAMHAAVIRVAAYSLPAAAPWALLPLVVRHQLGLDAGFYGLILGVMGVGGVTAGLTLPFWRRRFSRGGVVLIAGSSSAAGILVLASATVWPVAALGMLLFGLGWTASYSTIQAAAQLAAPPWVRARALAVYQLSYNGALTLGSFGWGWLATRVGLQWTLLSAGFTLLALTFGTRWLDLDLGDARMGASARPKLPTPEAPDARVLPQLTEGRARVLETVRYVIRPADRDAFLAAMAEVRRVRGRAGACEWRLFEDVAHPERWLERWEIESWTDHLREAARLSDDDLAALARAAGFQIPDKAAVAARYIAVDPPHGPGNGRGAWALGGAERRIAPGVTGPAVINTQQKD